MKSAGGMPLEFTQEDFLPVDYATENEPAYLQEADQDPKAIVFFQSLEFLISACFNLNLLVLEPSFYFAKRSVLREIAYGTVAFMRCTKG